MRHSAFPPALVVLLASLALLSLHAKGKAQNLLPNPFFREGVFGPGLWGLNEPYETRVEWLRCRDGGEEFALRLDSCGRDWAGASGGRVPVQPGESLTVAGWVKTDERIADGAHLYVRFFAEGRFLGQTGPALPPGISEWRLLQGQVTAPEGATYADVSLQVWSAGIVWLHSVAVVRGDEAQVARLLPQPKCDDLVPVPLPHGKPEDADANGLPDVLEKALGITPADKARSVRLTRPKTTSLQTPTGYREDNDLKIDRVIVAGNDERSIRSWQAFGYAADVMGGFRAGPEYVDQHPDEAQTDVRGVPLTCGPGSYYMVPTQNRRRIMAEYFADAVRHGASAVCPEEPEFFALAGYSGAFKREWQAYYGEPWQDPASSIDARLKSERLKAHLERQLLTDIYEASRQVNPQVSRFLLAHSPVNYTAWGITFAHADMVKSGLVDEMVAQVWTGTARSAVTHQGRSAERTFENGFLEYSSSWNLVRGTSVPVWFLMDPVEDNPGRAMEDYRDNYERTLAASLMFPEVDRFETMPWPTRIFGRVPGEFATEITSVINLLSDMASQASSPPEWDCGTQGIATFIGDWAMWQRGAPSPGDLNDLYGLCLPLVMRGIPAQIAHLDRLDTPGYLAPYHTLLLSYDLSKPQSPQANEAIAQWVRDGGSLLVCGGDDAYCRADEWWQEAGFAGPTEHLLSLLGWETKGRRVVEGAQETWQVVARTDYTGRMLENRKVEEVDLTPLLTDADAAYVKIEDTQKEDGWGALISRIEVRGTRDGKDWPETITPGTEAETAVVYRDDRTSLTASDPAARFTDGTTSIVYRFPFDQGTKATVRIDIGNQYQISVTGAAAALTRAFGAVTWKGAEGLWQLPAGQSFLTYDESGGLPLVSDGPDCLVSERAAGKGHVLFCGLPGRYFTGSEPADQQLRLLAERLVTAGGHTYAEKPYIKLRRGAYVVAKTFGQELPIPGRYLDVLRPDLPVVTDLRLPPNRVAVLLDVSASPNDKPCVLLSSSCVEWKSEQARRTRLIVSGPLGVRGACRLRSGKQEVAQVSATTSKGEPTEASTERRGDTVLLTFDNAPNGLAIDIRWQ